ncbi:MAG: hypothetical protein Q7K39_04985 [Candidatus Magasanikbacteria bacterium]|nr:hypothetical protein [Candidatus Magasanikbacteria bacterium]
MSTVIKSIKKVFTFSVVSTTILWSSMVSVLVPSMVSAAACPAGFGPGSMLKVVGRPPLYIMNNNNQLLSYFSGREYKTWTADDKYSGHFYVSQECFDEQKLPTMLPTLVGYRPGTMVVKRIASDQLYAVLPGNTLAKITVEAAKSLYGANFTAVVVDDVAFPHYVNRAATDITEAKPHEGMLVSNGGKNWYVDAGMKLREVNGTGFSANKFQTRYVHPVSDAMVAGYTSGEVISAEVAALVDRTQSGGVVVTPPPVNPPGPTPTSTPAPIGGNLTVSLAADNPAATYLASGTALNPVLKLSLSASSDTTVTSLKIRKSGFYANTNITGADVTDSKGMRHGNVVSTLSADSDLNIGFASEPIVVKAGMPETVLVRVNLIAGAFTGTFAMSVLAAGSVGSNGTVGGTFPITGNTFNVQDGSSSVAAVQINPQLVGSNMTLNADGTNLQDIAKFSIQETSSREEVNLMKLSLYNNGTAADSDYKDVQLVEQSSNKVLATAQPKNKVVMFDLGTGYMIGKGQTKYFLVRAILMNGAARTIQFVVYNNYDLEVKGTTTGSLVLPTTDSSTGNVSATAFPAGNATNYNKVTIGSGAVSFNKNSDSPSNAVIAGANNVVLAKFFIKPSGEDMELRKMMLGITNSGPKALAGTAYVKVDGATVYSVAASSVVTTMAGASISLSSYPVLKAGVNSYVTVEANIDSSAGTTNVYKVYMRPSEVKRLITNDITIDATTVLPASLSAGNNIAVQGTTLAVTTMSAPVAANVVAGTNSHEFARIELNAGPSGEDIRVNTIVVSDVISGGAALTNVANLTLYANGQPLLTNNSTAVNAASNTFTFSTPIVVTRANPVVISVKGDVVAGTAGSHTYRVSGTADVTAYGQGFGNTATITIAGSGQAMTVVSAGTLNLSLVSGPTASPSNDRMVTVGTGDVSVFGFKMSAQNEAQKLTTLVLTASSTAGNTLGSNDIVNVRLYLNNSATPFASANAGSCASSVCTFTWTNTDNVLPETVQPGFPATVYVKANIGQPGSAAVTNAFKFYFATSSTTDVVFKGAFSGATSTVAGLPIASGLTIVSPWNVTISGEAPAAGTSLTQTVGAGTQIGRFKIMNNGTGQVTVTDLRFTDNGSHTGTTTTYKLYYSDEGSTNYIGNTATTTVTDFSSSVLDFSGGMTNFTINGNSYRYITVAISTAGNIAAGNSWALALPAFSDAKYSITESNLGYSNNGDADLEDTVTGAFMEGKPSLGTLVKQST